MALSKSHRVTMNDGNTIPVLGLGTYRLKSVPKSESEMATKVAIEVGFQHFDGAFLYDNEKEVGQAIRVKIADGTVTREDIFYMGKLSSTCHRPELVRPALGRDLKSLQLDYLDLYIIHWPVFLKDSCGLVVPGVAAAIDRGPAFDFYPAPSSPSCAVIGLAMALAVGWSTCRHIDQALSRPLSVLVSVPLRQPPSSSGPLPSSYFPLKLLVFEFQLTTEDMKIIEGINRNLCYLTFNQ
ncbi:LOW QUALITY PROTEIN: putative aldo-keto reductase family 1 member C8 [Petaurus breviceps papuanus]|uniref:LOW QUALITY PROTEIN: putative aldo-keto reductase family 1 member C8 n=1 Tax=Petaurus breviceps papuanus TaxID=3040969 RepID=UPI0036DB679C